MALKRSTSCEEIVAKLRQVDVLLPLSLGSANKRPVFVADATCGSSQCSAHAKKRSAIIEASEFDEKFDAGEDLSAVIDWSKAKRINAQVRRVNVDFPAWVVTGLDRQARHLGVTRQSLIKLWIAERLQ